MAVEDKYTDADIVAGKKANALKTGTGTKTVTLVGTVSVAAADDDDSVYRVLSNVPSNFVPLTIEIHNTAITAGDDYDLGLYKVNEGAVVEVDILADDLDMSSARTIATSNNAGMSSLTLAEVKTLGELSGQTDVDSAYDIALTANTVGTADGTIRVTATFAYA